MPRQFSMENAAMRFIVLAVVAFPVSALDGRKTDNDKLPGEVWSFDASKGELNRKGEFRIHDKKVYFGEKNLGTAAVKGDEAVLVVRGGGVLNGRIVLERDGQSWRGVVHHGDGSKWSIVVSVKQDKPKEKPERKKKP